VSNPTANDPHTLSTRYGIAIRRIEAILCLKQLESQWKQVRVNPSWDLFDPLFMMSKTISLEDNYMVKTSIHAWLSDPFVILVTSVLLVYSY
jgi:Eukaryotic mitochondrial regulator protein